MSNIEILAYEKMAKGINEDLYTYAAWKSQGYQVVKGEKAILTTQLWKNTSYKDKKTGEEKNKMIMTKASLFSRSQVEKIK